MNSRPSIQYAGAVAAFILAMTPVLAVKLDPRNARSLRRLDPDLRLEQICDLEAMARIGRDGKFSPDRAKSDIFSHPEHHDDAMYARGAAFRSGGRWYRFSFSCTGTPDHLDVASFSYTLGPEVPRRQWADYGLW